MIEDEESVKIKNKSEAIRKLYPQVATITPGEVWKCVDKNNVSVAIDESKVTKEVDRADAEYASLAYARKRKDEYPPLAEQLDLLWHAIDAGTLDDRDHRNKFYTILKQVKENNPKG